MLNPGSITQAEIDSAIKRSGQWTRHRQAMQILGAALRAHSTGRRLSDVLTAQQIELLSIGFSGPNDLQPPLGR